MIEHGLTQIGRYDRNSSRQLVRQMARDHPSPRGDFQDRPRSQGGYSAGHISCIRIEDQRNQILLIHLRNGAGEDAIATGRVHDDRLRKTSMMPSSEP
ncbi:hypothetical protein D3C72_2219740 [compost metagenome]